VRYPYERFLRFLVSRKADVASAIVKLGLPPVGGLFEVDCRTHFRKTAPATVLAYLDSADRNIIFTDGVLEWAESEGIRPLWEIQPEFRHAPDPGLEVCLRIFMNPVARAVTGLLLFSKASQKDAAALLAERYDVPITEEMLAMYSRLFWDVAGMGRGAWPDFIARLLTKTERHWLGLGLGSPTLEDVKRFLGVERELDPQVVIRSVMTHSFNRFESAMNEPHPDDHGAYKWAELALKAAHELQASKPSGPVGGGSGADGGTAGSLAGDRLFSVRVDKTPITTLAELQGEISETPMSNAERKAR